MNAMNERDIRPVTDPEALREHAYMLLQRDAKLSLADCKFYEQEILRWVEGKHTFTAYEVSHDVNGQLIKAGRAWLRHALTGAAVHLLVSLYGGPAGYRSDPVDIGGGRVPRLYYPDESGRRQWEAAHTPAATQTGKPSMPPALPGKPGRKTITTADLVAYANERRPGITWKDICSGWKKDYPNDLRNKDLTGESFREACKRAKRRNKLLDASLTRGGLIERPEKTILHPPHTASYNLGEDDKHESDCGFATFGEGEDAGSELN